MNADERVVYSGSPSIVADDSVTTTAALPLSNMSVSLDTSVAVPSAGIGRCSVTACWPCTSSAGLNVPMPDITERPAP